MPPLSGIRVIEMAEFGFVPAGGAILADWGADVVKIERPSGDPLRQVMGAGFVADTGDFNFLWELYNRNKRGVALDLRNPEGRAVLDKLLEGADVLMTNFLPSARKKLRVEPEDAWNVNPQLVYARGHGQGQRGPDADHGGFDAVSYWARGGIGHMLTPSGGPLVMQRAAMGDGPSGAILAGGIAAALLERSRTGKGVLVDVSLLNSAVWTLGPDLTATTILGEDPPTQDARRPLSNPLIGSYRTADARWLLLNMLDDMRHWAPTCRALGLDELIDDPRYAETAGRAEHREVLHERIRTTLAERPLAEWRTRLSAEDTIWSVMASPVEVIVDAQVEANRYLAPHPDHERARLATGPCQFDDALPTVRHAAPSVGEHTDELLADAGIAHDEIRRLRDAGAVA